MLFYTFSEWLDLRGRCEDLWASYGSRAERSKVSAGRSFEAREGGSLPSLRRIGVLVPNDVVQSLVGWQLRALLIPSCDGGAVGNWLSGRETMVLAKELAKLLAKLLV